MLIFDEKKECMAKLRLSTDIPEKSEMILTRNIFGIIWENFNETDKKQNKMRKKAYLSSHELVKSNILKSCFHSKHILTIIFLF